MISYSRNDTRKLTSKTDYLSKSKEILLAVTVFVIYEVR